MEATATATSSQRDRLVTIRLVTTLLVVASVLPYLVSATYGYVLDDTTAIRGNPDLAGWDSLWRVWTHRYGGAELPFYGLYRPLTMTLFAFLWNVGGHWPLWFHVTAVAMHAAATVLVWRVLRAGLAPTRAPAVLAALWFAVQPVHVEAVANIANSSEVLVALWTCALALYLRHVDASGRSVTWRVAVVAGLLYLAAFLTKESGAMAPLLAILFVWGWRRQGDRSAVRADADSVRRWMPVLVGWTAAAMIVVALRALVLGGPVTGESIAAPGLDALTTPERMWAMFSLGPLILRLLLWPATVNPHYGPSTFPAHEHLRATAAFVLLVLAVLLAARRAWRGDRRVLAALLWMGIAFLPASNLLVPTGQILAERTLYVPSIGAAMLMALALEWSLRVAGERSTVLRGALVACAAVWVAATTTRTAGWTGVWKDHETLFAQMIAADTAGYRGYWFSGVYEGRNGRMDRALVLLDQAYSRYQHDPGMLQDYGDALLDQGQPARAAVIGARLMSWPQYRAKPAAVGMYLDALGRAYGADSVVVAGLRLMSRAPSATAALFLGHAYEVRGERSAARGAYRAGLRLAPADMVLRRRADALASSP